MCAWLLSDWAWVQGSEKQVRRPDKLSESKPGRQRDRVADQGPGHATSMDQDFIDSQRNTSRPEHLGDGVAKGIYSLGKGVASGVGGLFLDPIKGFQKEGFTGAGKGVVKGLVGVIVKPAAGALGLVTNITEGIANTGQALEGGGAATRSRAYRPRFSSPNTEGGIHGPGTHILKGSNWSRRAAHTSIIVRSGGDV